LFLSALREAKANRRRVKSFLLRQFLGICRRRSEAFSGFPDDSLPSLRTCRTEVTYVSQ
jgi:hypothetical protein